MGAKGRTCQPTVAPYPPLVARSESPFRLSYGPAIVPRGLWGPSVGSFSLDFPGRKKSKNDPAPRQYEGRLRPRKYIPFNYNPQGGLASLF